MGTTMNALAERLGELEKQATPGRWYTLGAPWLPPGCETSILAGSDDPHVAKFVCDFENFGVDEGDEEGPKNGWNDAALIVALKNALPKILEALRDAERYKQLRHAESDLVVYHLHKRPIEHYYGTALDAAIDTAIDTAIREAK